MKLLYGLAALSLLNSFNTYAQSEGISYSYLTVGNESISYKETATLVPVKSDASVSNLMLNSGGLYDINETFAFSVDALATFSPNSDNEEWTHETFGVYQRNQFEYIHASTHLALHYKLTENFRVIGGTALSLITYKRTGINLNLQDGSVIKGGMQEEKSNEIYLDAGIAYESGKLSESMRYGFKATVGHTIWSETYNTQFDGLDFATDTLRYNLEANVSFKVTEGIHLGAYARYSMLDRGQEGPVEWTGTLVDRESTFAVEFPEGETTNSSVGLMLLWDL
ncbi:hypothetical protein AAEU28_18230 [Pseudoalteromonas sp. SS15]|uniref:hypothetical protein n=1 Tax=Pseudoalteromonas sp. SS15 TaxID=3139393 RepID=UPI003BAC3140